MAEKCWMYDGCKSRTAVCNSKGPDDDGCPVYRYFRDLIGKQKAEAAARPPVIAESVTELRQLLADGRIPEIGQIALRMRGMEWRCIDHTEENGVVLMMAAAYDWRPFARPDKQHPWGWNNYEASQIRKELNSEILEDLFGDEQELLEYWLPGQGKLFLLSDEEAGFEQTEATFAWFRGSSESVLDSRRMLKDRDGDPAYWWLRSPHPSVAYGVRYVSSSGALSSITAYGGYSAAAACVITQS